MKQWTAFVSIKSGSSGSSCRRSCFHDTRWWASTQRTALCCSTTAADIQCPNTRPNTSLILLGNDSPVRLLDKTLNLVVRTSPTYASSHVIIFLVCMCSLNLLNVYFGSQMFTKSSHGTMYSLIITMIFFFFNSSYFHHDFFFNSSYYHHDYIIIFLSYFIDFL